MIGCALKGQVEGYLDAELACLCDQAPEVFDGPELRVNGLMAAVVAADGPGTAGVGVGSGGDIVGALALRQADRVDRGQIQHVEAHRGDVGERGLNVGKGAVRVRIGARRTGKHLIPA